MTTILLAVVASATVMSSASEIQIVNMVQSKSKSSQIVKDGQPLEVELRKARLAIKFPSGKAGAADITMLYEPTSRLFWWRYQTIEPDQPSTDVATLPDDLMIYITGGKVTAFGYFISSLYVRESTAHFLSLDEGQTKVLARIKDNADKIERGTMEWSRDINVGAALGVDFLHLKGSAAPFPQARIREISRKEGQWRLMFDGPNNDRAEVVLDADYHLISATVLPSKEQ